MSQSKWAEGSQIPQRPDAEVHGGLGQDQERRGSSFRPSIESASSGSSTGLFDESSYPPDWDQSWVIGDDGNWEPPPPSSPSRTRKLRATLDAFWLRNKGVLFVLLSQFFGSCMNLATRILENAGEHGRGMHPFQLLFTRMFVTFVLSVAYMWYTGIGPLGDRKVRVLLIIRGMGGFLGVCGLYYSLVYLPISEAVVLTFLGPMLSCYVYSFLQPLERFTHRQQIASYISIGGVIIIARPISLIFPSSNTPTPEMSAPQFTNSTVLETSQPPTPSHAPLNPTTSQHLFAILLGLMGVFGGATALTTIRVIGQRAHPLVSITYFATWCTLVSTLSFIFIPGVDFRLPENGQEWGLLLLVGISGFVMQVLLTAGLAYSTSNAPHPANKTLSASAVENQTPSQQRQNSNSTSTNTNPAGKSGGSRATSMLYTQMLFALIFDKLVWGITPNIWSWAGSGLILGSVIWASLVTDDNVKTGSNGNTSAGSGFGGRSRPAATATGAEAMELQGLGLGQTKEMGKGGEEERQGLMAGMESDDEDEGQEEEDGGQTHTRSTTTPTVSSSSSTVVGTPEVGQSSRNSPTSTGQDGSQLDSIDS